MNGMASTSGHSSAPKVSFDSQRGSPSAPPEASTSALPYRGAPADAAKLSYLGPPSRPIDPGSAFTASQVRRPSMDARVPPPSISFPSSAGQDPLWGDPGLATPWSGSFVPQPPTSYPHPPTQNHGTFDASSDPMQQYFTHFSPQDMFAFDGLEGATKPKSGTRKRQKKANRSRASCDQCRRRRTRCDRTLPCSECVKRKVGCDYTEANITPLALNREKNETMDRDEYVALLERRVRELEEAAARSIRSATELVSPEDETEGDSPAGPQGQNGGSSASPGRRASTSVLLEAEVVSDSSDTPPSDSDELLVDLAANELAAELCALSLGPDFRAERSRRSRTLIDDLSEVAAQAKNAIGTDLTPFEKSLTMIAADPSIRLDFATREGPKDIEAIVSILPTKEQVDCCLEVGLYLAHGTGSIDGADFARAVAEFYMRDPRDDLHMLACVLAFASTILFRKWTGLDMPGLGPMTSEEASTLAKEWLLGSIRALVLGNIFEKPTVTGIRALSLLGYLPLHVTALHTAMFAWSTATYLAGKLGLHEEPPGHDADEVSPEELESRRRLLWVGLLGVDFGAAGYLSKHWHLADPETFTCRPPGMDSRVTALGPDGWPTDLYLACGRASAGWFRMHQVVTTMIAKRRVRYSELRELEQAIDAFDASVPDLLNIQMRGNQLRFAVSDSNSESIIMQYQLARLPVVVRAHRLIVLGKLKLPRADEQRHLRKFTEAIRCGLVLFRTLPGFVLLHTLVVLLALDMSTSLCAALLTCDIDDPILDPELILPDLRWLIEFLSRVPEAFIRSGSNLLATLVGKVEARMTPENRAKRMRHRHDSLSERKVAREEPEQLPHKKTRSPDIPPNVVDAGHPRAVRTLKGDLKTISPPPSSSAPAQSSAAPAPAATMAADPAKPAPITLMKNTDFAFSLPEYCSSGSLRNPFPEHLTPGS